jgi:hypothetical protein
MVSDIYPKMGFEEYEKNKYVLITKNYESKITHIQEEA